MSIIVAASFEQLPHPPSGSNPCTDTARNMSYCCTSNDEFFCTPTDKAVATTFVAGMLQIIMGILNLGVVVDFIGNHVLNGFITAAAITIFTSQSFTNCIKSKWRNTWIRYVFWSQHLGCPGPKHVSIQHKEV